MKLKREDFFETDDNLCREERRRDCEKIMNALKNKGFTSCGIGNAEFVWSEFSDTMAAGFLSVPDNEDQIYECVKPHLYKPVYAE